MDSKRIVWSGLVVAAGLQNLSAQTIAKRSGLSEKVVRDSLNSPRNLQLQSVERMLDVMGLNLKELCDLGALMGEFMAQRKLPIAEGGVGPIHGDNLAWLVSEIVEIAHRVDEVNKRLQKTAVVVSKIVATKIDSAVG